MEIGPPSSSSVTLRSVSPRRAAAARRLRREYLGQDDGGAAARRTGAGAVPFQGGGDAFDDLEAVSLEPDELSGIVAQQPELPDPQLDQDLGADPVVPQVGGKAEGDVAASRATPGGAQGALISVDRDGAILAMIGGTDYVETNYNRATNAMRQPGSSWKLFVYLAALEAGYTPEDRVVDTPVSIGGWSPRNSNGRNIGETNLRTAFAYSINTVAAQLGNEVGFGSVASMARRFGITTPINTYPAMVLGSNEVRLIDMTRAFAAISAKDRSRGPVTSYVSPVWPSSVRAVTATSAMSSTSTPRLLISAESPTSA